MIDRQEGQVAGVLLAAGLSRRMGRNKLLLELGGESVVRRVGRAAAAAGLDPLIAVLGHEGDRVREELDGLRCAFVSNAEPARGMGSSIGAGFRAVPDEASAAVALLGDMPLVSAAMIRRLVDRFRETSAALVISSYEGVRAPPILYGRALFGELRALLPDAAGRQVAERHRARAAEVAWSAEALVDLDVPEDLERARALLASAGLARGGP